MAMTPMKSARLAGAFYLVTVLSSIFGIVVTLMAGTMLSAPFVVAGVAYLGVTLFLYLLFRPVRPRASLLAALISLAGIVLGPVMTAFAVPHGFSIDMAVFGVYLILLGYLIDASRFIPRVLALLLVIGGAGYLLNFLVALLLPGLSVRLYPWILMPGFAAETLFCLWILVKGVAVQASSTRG